MIAQLTRPQSGLSSARHMTPTTIGVISIGRSRMPRTIHDPRSCRLKNMASATPSTTWMATENEHHDGAVLGCVPELRVDQQRAVIVEADEIAGAGRGGQIRKRQPQAVEQRVDAENDQVEHARAEEQPDGSPRLVARTEDEFFARGSGRGEAHEPCSAADLPFMAASGKVARLCARCLPTAPAPCRTPSWRPAPRSAPR